MAPLAHWYGPHACTAARKQRAAPTCRPSRSQRASLSEHDMLSVASPRPGLRRTRPVACAAAYDSTSCCCGSRHSGSCCPCCACCAAGCGAAACSAAGCKAGPAASLPPCCCASRCPPTACSRCRFANGFAPVRPKLPGMPSPRGTAAVCSMPAIATTGAPASALPVVLPCSQGEPEWRMLASPQGGWLTYMCSRTPGCNSNRQPPNSSAPAAAALPAAPGALPLSLLPGGRRHSTAVLPAAAASAGAAPPAAAVAHRSAA